MSGNCRNHESLHRRRQSVVAPVRLRCRAIERDRRPSADPRVLAIVATIKIEIKLWNAFARLQCVRQIRCPA
jgi:hypothetical protein